MLASINDAEGNLLDARLELEDGAIILHSRGGAFGKPNLTNPDYRKALRAILERLGDTDVRPSGVWVGSRVAQAWPEPQRRLLDSTEFARPVDQLLSLIGQRGLRKGVRTARRATATAPSGFELLYPAHRSGSYKRCWALAPVSAASEFLPKPCDSLSPG
jgi:hypothetical protein